MTDHTEMIPGNDKISNEIAPEISRKSEPTADFSKEITPESETSTTTSDIDIDAEAQPSIDHSAPPDGGYGWVCVGAVFVFNMCTWGANSAFAVYLAHYLNENKYPGATKIDYAFIGGFSIGLGPFVAPAITYLSEFVHIQLLLAIGIILSATATILASFTKQIWQLYLTQGVLQGISLAIITIPVNAVLPQWFSKKRTLANGIASGGSGLGGIMFSLSMQAIIRRWDVAWALRAQAIMCFILGCSAITLIKTRNKIIQPHFKFFDASLLKIWGFIWLLLWAAFAMLGYVIILYSLSDYAKTIGLTSSQGSVIPAMISLGAIFGRPLVGLFSDRYGKCNAVTVAHLITIILIFAMWIPCKNYATLIAFGILAGGTIGTIFASFGVLTAEVVGLKRLPSALTPVWMIIGITGIFSQAIGLQLKADTAVNPYLNTQIFTGFMYMGAVLSSLLLRSWKIRQNALTEGRKVNFVKGLFSYANV